MANPKSNIKHNCVTFIVNSQLWLEGSTKCLNTKSTVEVVNNVNRDISNLAKGLITSLSLLVTMNALICHVR